MASKSVFNLVIVVSVVVIFLGTALAANAPLPQGPNTFTGSSPVYGGDGMPAHGNVDGDHLSIPAWGFEGHWDPELGCYVSGDMRIYPDESHEAYAITFPGEGGKPFTGSGTVHQG